MANRVLASVAALLVALAVEVGLSTAAPGTFNADASGAREGRVRIDIVGRYTGPQPGAFESRIAHGRFTLSGALSDRGIFEDYRHGNHARVRTLFGAKGYFAIAFVGPSPNWRVGQGTFAYTGLRGRGTGRGGHSPGPFEITMVGRVSQ